MAGILAAFDELEGKDSKAKKKNAIKPTNTEFRNPFTKETQQFVSIDQEHYDLDWLIETTI